MKILSFRNFLTIALFTTLFNQNIYSQCFQIESILVAACSPQNLNQEGYNEMVRFKIGNTAQNTSNFSVDWPSNNWQGLAQNSTTQAKVTQLNANILAAGGCGQLIEPTGGVLPANSTVIIITSYLFDVASNSFGALNENYYILFQNNTSTTGGHFGNYNSTPGIRTLEISFGGCSDTVSYQRANLSPEMGATVNFTANGTATYVNNGCSAPIPPFNVDAGNSPNQSCAGSTVNLSANAMGYTTILWSAQSGNFSANNVLNPTYTIPNDATADITLTITATNSCGNEIQDTVIVPVSSGITPNFDINPITICSGSTPPTLLNTSPNGVTGIWNPATINNSTSGTYTFTPNSGQCATTVSLNVTVTNSILPDFDLTPITICTGSTAPLLSNTAPNGITGIWSPAIINNTNSGNYTFTPNAGQCASSVTLNVTVTNSITPNFDLNPLTICTGSATPVLSNISPNGISGTWSPSVINNITSGSYTFTPNTGQCASSVTLNVTVSNSTTPNFDLTTLSFCSGSNVPTLSNTSPNGITGVWNPSVISNTASGNYTFTPNAGQCATSVILAVNINNTITPNFDVTPINICKGQNVPTLSTTSPNGISGIWSPAVISNMVSGTYTFTPTASQCALPVTLTVTVNDVITPNFDLTTLNLCSGAEVPTLNNTSPNGILGTWNPNTINNENSATYIFTPNANQCAIPVSLQVVITPFVLPEITGEKNICVGSTTFLSNMVTNGIWKSSDETIATVDQNGFVNAISVGKAIISYEISTNGCSGTSTFEIEIHDLPKPHLIDNAICQDKITGEFISYAILDTHIPANGQYIFQWKLDGEIITNNTAAIEANLPGVYEVTVTHIITGCSQSASASVVVVNPATASATIDFELDLKQTITINTIGGSGDFLYQLQNGPLQESNVFYGIYSGDYTIRIVDKKGCDNIYLSVFAINYPRFFTPNNDGYNDTWNIKDISDQTDATIHIFDRYGKLIKKIKPSGEGWDGTLNGNLLPSTDYWFVLNYLDRNGNNKEHKGHFTLKR